MSLQQQWNLLENYVAAVAPLYGAGRGDPFGNGATLRVRRS